MLMATAFIIIHIIWFPIFGYFIVQVINKIKREKSKLRNIEKSPWRILRHLHKLTYIYNYLVYSEIVTKQLFWYTVSQNPCRAIKKMKWNYQCIVFLKKEKTYNWQSLSTWSKKVKWWLQYPCMTDHVWNTLIDHQYQVWYSCYNRQNLFNLYVSYTS